MVSVVPSRFAGLKIEDDDDESQKQSKKTPNKQQTPTKADTNLKKQVIVVAFLLNVTAL